MSKQKSTPVIPGDSTKRPHYDVATKIVHDMRAANNGTLGVLLTLAEMVITDEKQLKSYKDQIRREMHGLASATQDSIYWRLGIQDYPVFTQTVFYTDREVS